MRVFTGAMPLSLLAAPIRVVRPTPPNWLAWEVPEHAAVLAEPGRRTGLRVAHLSHRRRTLPRQRRLLRARRQNPLGELGLSAGARVIDLEDVSDIDTMASEQLDQLLDDLAATGVEVSLTLVRQTVRICWNTPGCSIGSERIEYPWRSMAPSVGCAQAGDRVRAHWVLQHHWRRMWT